MGEREIVELLLQRDETGMDQLLRHYGPLMKYVIAPILPDPRDRGGIACPRRPCGCGSGWGSLTGNGAAGGPGSPPWPGILP